MSLVPIIASILFMKFGSIAVRRALAMALWLIVIVVVYLIVAEHARAEESWSVAWSVPIAPPLEAQPAPEPRGTVLTLERSIHVPETGSTRTQLKIAASADGSEPLRVDDVLRVRFGRSDGTVLLRFERDFRRTDGSGIEPYGPLDVSGLLPPGEIVVWVEVLDVRPPLYAASPLFLVALVPGSESSAGHDGKAAASIGAAAPTDVETNETQVPILNDGSPEAPGDPLVDHSLAPDSPDAAPDADSLAVGVAAVISALFVALLLAGLATRAALARLFWRTVARLSRV